MNPNYDVTDGHYNARIPGKLGPYEKEVIELRSQGLTYSQIHKILYKKVIRGVSLPLGCLCKKKEPGCMSRKNRIGLNLYSLVKEFYTAIFSKKPEKLDAWLKSAQKHNIPELQSFVEVILKDLTAVKNGILYPYNNGLAEGSVNKIKVIKRVMYGRNSFELLKDKALFHELFHAELNYQWNESMEHLRTVLTVPVPGNRFLILLNRKKHRNKRHT